MPAVGDVLAGRYRIDGRLGAGGMATVWRARDLRLGRDVAVKVLLPNLSGDAAMAARFDREARALAAVADPRIVAVFDVVDGDPGAGREPFLVMELCPAGSLGDHLGAAGTINEAEILPILADVAEGLAVLHARGLIHRDITPRNVLITAAGAKLGDFGLARTEATDDMTPLTPPGLTVGTTAYLAPEVRSGGRAGPAADVYGLAAVAWRALSGVPPGGPTTGNRAAAPGASPELAALLAEALDPDPARRPTAHQLATRLRDLAFRIAGSPETSWEGPRAEERARPSGTAIAPTHMAPPPVPSAPPSAVRHPAAPGSMGVSSIKADAARPAAQRPRLPPPGPGYRGPGLWSGELLLALLVAAVVVGIVLVLFGR